MITSLDPRARQTRWDAFACLAWRFRGKLDLSFSLARVLQPREGDWARPVRIEQAQGMLVAALGVLAGYYGYGPK